MGVSRSCFGICGLGFGFTRLLLRCLGFVGGLRLRRLQLIDGALELVDLGLQRLELGVVRQLGVRRTTCAQNENKS